MTAGEQAGDQLLVLQLSYRHGTLYNSSQLAYTGCSVLAPCAPCSLVLRHILATTSFAQGGSRHQMGTPCLHLVSDTWAHLGPIPSWTHLGPIPSWTHLGTHCAHMDQNKANWQYSFITLLSHCVESQNLKT